MYIIAWETNLEMGNISQLTERAFETVLCNRGI